MFDAHYNNAQDKTAKCAVKTLSMFLFKFKWLQMFYARERR